MYDDRVLTYFRYRPAMAFALLFVLAAIWVFSNVTYSVVAAVFTWVGFTLRDADDHL